MIGTSVNRRERPAEKRGSISNGGMVPNSSQKSTTRFFSLPPFSSATANSSRLRFWIMRPAMKFLVVSSSGRIRKMADFSEANFSASMALSKHRICSSSLSREEARFLGGSGPDVNRCIYFYILLHGICLCIRTEMVNLPVKMSHPTQSYSLECDGEQWTCQTDEVLCPLRNRNELGL